MEENQMGKKSDLVMMIVSSIVCLSPIILALMVYDELPEQLPIHWNLFGQPTRYTDKAISAFGIPIILLIINFLIRISMKRTTKNYPKAIHGISYWIIPFLSISLVPLMLYGSMEVKIPIQRIVIILFGALFILSGNYIPKTKLNYFFGIRLPWTLNDSDNWNKTHRLAGFLWVIGGLILIIISFLTLDYSIMQIILISGIGIMIIVPVFYSCFLYMKGKNQRPPA
jgi:uncharacterized membrane protein